MTNTKLAPFIIFLASLCCVSSLRADIATFQGGGDCFSIQMNFNQQNFIGQNVTCSGSATPALSGYDFGTVSGLSFEGGLINTTESQCDVIHTVQFRYRIYEVGTTAPGWQTVDLGISGYSELNNGCPAAQYRNKTWTFSQNMDLTSGLPNGSYVLEVSPIGYYEDHTFNWQNAYVCNKTCTSATLTNSNATVQGAGSIFSATVVLYNQVLPVVWGEIQGNKVKNGIAVNWNVEQELNVYDYQLERLEASGIWTAIGTSVFPNTLKEYTVIDLNPQLGDNLYRIRQTDLDGTKNYSELLNVSFQSSLSLVSVFPNPASNELTISLPDNGFHLAEFYDQSGNRLKQSSGQYQLKMEVRDLPKGVYVCHIPSLDHTEIVLIK